MENNIKSKELQELKKYVCSLLENWGFLFTGIELPKVCEQPSKRNSGLRTIYYKNRKSRGSNKETERISCSTNKETNRVHLSISKFFIPNTYAFSCIYSHCHISLYEAISTRNLQLVFYVFAYSMRIAPICTK